METALNLITIIISIVMIGVILMQTKGSAFGNSFGGDSGSIYKTRRGFEKTLFQATLGIIAFFLLLAIISSFVMSS